MPVLSILKKSSQILTLGLYSSFHQLNLSYNSYHTNLILLYHFDSLSFNHKSAIPDSTLSNWKKKDISKIIGCDSVSSSDVAVLRQIAKSKRLLLVAKALYFLFQTLHISCQFHNSMSQIWDNQFQ